MINVAILSPNREAYSETFIKAQKDLIPQKVFYYYDGTVPQKLEGGVSYQHPSFLKKTFNKFLRKQPDYLKNYLKKSFTNNKIQLVLAEFGPTGAANIDLCRELNIPMVVHFHGADAYVKQFINPIEPYTQMFKYAAAIVVVSEDMKNQLIGLGAPEDKIHLTCYGPRPDFFDIQPAFSTKNFLAIGRFVDKKAPYYTILAFAEVAAIHPDARLIMAGDGPLLNTCQNLCKYLSISSQVEFVGSVNHEKVRQLMQSSLAFVQHSITAADGDKEGSPVAIIEASAAGLPVVATYHAGIPQSVLHGETGLLVQEGEVDQMAQYMLRLVDEAGFAEQLGSAAKKHIRENVSMDKYISSLNAIMLKVANQV